MLPHLTIYGAKAEEGKTISQLIADQKTKFKELEEKKGTEIMKAPQEVKPYKAE